jgi:hypothetical protein
MTKLRLAIAISAAGLVAALAAWPAGGGDPAGPGPGSDGAPDIRLVATADNNSQFVTNSLDGRPILTVANLGPGQSRSGQVTLKNAGSAAQSVSVWQAGLATGPTGRPDLAAWVRLTVYDGALKTNVYDGTYAGFATSTRPLLVCGVPTKKSTCPAWDKNESHTFTFTVTFPDAGTSIDRYQSTWLRSTFNWTSVH